ncbi:MAG: ferredoxin family protein [Planctomycetes bacterium]|nr:ferredoxin family protein [Planctomycetota bacterium]
MPHIVTERCVDCRYTDCATVCPVQCFWELQSPAMLVIDPDTCIDCGLCIPECPVHAIYPEDDVPEPYKPWIAKNRELFPSGTNITEKKEPLATAITLEDVHQRESASGWAIGEPAGG